MTNDRLLNILRWVVTPLALAAITGYFQVRVSAAKEQTRATYDTLAPNVLELQEKVAVLTGRLEELSKRPASAPCPEVPKVGKAAVRSPKPFGGYEGTALGGVVGKTSLMVDSPEPPPPEPAPANRLPARFDDMLQQKKY